MGTTIGIDLGTTNTAIAVLTDGRPRVLEDEKGYKVLPSCVSIKADGSFTVGQAAKSLIITEPDRTVYAAKRLLGRRYDTGEVNVAKERVSYEIAQSEDGNCLVRLGDEYYTPVEVSALILQVVKGIAERAVGDTVDEAVITVPAYFNHAQRAATLEAAELAGLRCDRLLNEPTAAALAYGYKKDIERTILVFDLGGGTFDVSVLRLSTGVYEVLSTSGDTFLGGEDFDYRLVDHLAEHFQSNHGVDLREDRTTLQRLKDAAERAKCELSFTDRTTVMVPRITATENLELAVSRLTLESLVQDLVDRTMEVTKKAVSEAGLQASEIDDIILVGGQTRMPKLREAIAALFRKDPSRTVHPEEVVAIGAAVHASSISEPEGASTVLLDVTPFDLGIDVAGGLFQTIIARNSPVPATAAQVFATAQERQETIRLTIRQGESRFAEENEFLGEFLMSGLTPAPRMETKVEVSFRLDNNGMLHVTAKEPLTGESRRVTIRNYAEVAQSEGGIQARLEGDVSSESDIQAAGQSARDAINNLLDGDSGTGPKKKLTRAEKKALKKKRAEEAKKAKEDAKKKKLEEKEAAKKKKLEEKEAAKKAKEDAKKSKKGGTPPSDATADSVPAPDSGEPPEAQVDGSPEIEDLAMDDIQDLTDLAIDDIEEIQPAPEVATFEEPSIDDANEPHDETFGFSDSLDDEIDAALRMAETDSSPATTEPDTQDLAAPVDDGEASPEENVAQQVFDIEDDEPLTDASTSMDIAPDLAPLHVESDNASSITDDGDEDLDALVADALAELGFDEEGGEDDLLDLPTGLDASELVDDHSEDDEEVHDEATDTGSSTVERGDSELPEDEDLLGGLDFDLSADSEDNSDPSPTPTLRDSEEDQEEVTVVPNESSETGDAMANAGDFGDLGDLDDDDLFSMPDSLDESANQDDESRSDDDFSANEEDELAVDLSSDISFANADSSESDVASEVEADLAPTNTDETVSTKSRRKPARLKLAYSEDDDLVVEYQENLRRGGCFVSTAKPLSVGRAVEIHVSSPGTDEPIILKGTVTWSSAGMESLPEGQSAGMGIEYTLDADEHLALEEQLLRLKLGL